ncbi:MAG: phosphatase PAP2 family protein [Salibacteraceae bacterium]
MLELLQEIDQSLTLLVNHANSSNADSMMVLFSHKLTWAPLYAALLFLFQKIFGWKRTAYILLAIIINVVLTDQISVMMKEYFLRLRPCHEAGFKEMLLLADGCGGKYGFVSSHAANTMGLAVLVLMILKNKWMTIGMICFALVNGYSRIYLGKHYFFDVVGGFALGAFLGLIVYYGLKFAIKKFNL